MFTYKEINTLKGLLYASSCTKSKDIQNYTKEFNHALDIYFECYPNDDFSDNEFSDGQSASFDIRPLL